MEILEKLRLNSGQDAHKISSAASTVNPILTGKRVVFIINGNKFRLIVDIEFRLKIVFVVWFGTHAEYDLVDSK